MGPSFKFAANISTMFTETSSLLERYDLAAKCGFSAVECQFPYEYDVKILKQFKENSGVEQVLINSYPGTDGNEFGFALNSQDIFSDQLKKSLLYARSLNSKFIHILAGFNKPGISYDMMRETYLENMEFAAELCEEFNIVGVIEVLCKEVKRNYFLSNYDKALEYVKQIDSKNLKLLLDVYHLQMTSGNLTNFITSSFSEIGHIQISQAPKRNEPSSAGEINYKYILTLLASLGYTGWIGLEYYPSGSTSLCLQWIEEYGYKIQ